MRISQPAQPGSDQRVNMTLDLHMSGFGEPVHITPPPASDVRDLTDLAKQAAAAGATTGAG